MKPANSCFLNSDIVYAPPRKYPARWKVANASNHATTSPYRTGNQAPNGIAKGCKPDRLDYGTLNDAHLKETLPEMPLHFDTHNP